VNTLYVKVPGLTEFLARDDWPTFRQRYSLMCNVIVDGGPADDFGALVRACPRWVGPEIRVMLPLRNRRDLQAIKIASSLGVGVMLDLFSDDIDWSLIDELVTDALLAPARRASVDPFTMLAAIYLEPGNKFCLGSIYHDHCKEYLQVDAAGQVYRSRRLMAEGTSLGYSVSDREEMEATSGCAEDAEHSRLQMMKQTACSFCEAFHLCRGYLGKVQPEGHCLNLFRRMSELVVLRSRRGDRKGQAPLQGRP
jgi:radical SAM protein with 4Fe4S-binding SPASM domain